MPDQDSRIKLPESFPQSDYTPYGYLDNPYHTAVLNPSGVLRSVPPLGHGFWARALPWTYAGTPQRKLGYLSLLRLSLVIDGVALHTEADYEKHGVRRVSRFHTKNLISYDAEFRGVRFSAKYALLGEHTLVCEVSLEDVTESEEARECTVHVIHDYGYPDHRYWGCDGVRSLYRPVEDAAVAKVWAYGDIFALGANRKSSAFKATDSEAELARWIAQNDLSKNDGALVHFSPGLFASGFRPDMRSEDGEADVQDHVCTVLSYPVVVGGPLSSSSSSSTLMICLARGVNEVAALETLREGLLGAEAGMNQKLAADEMFYRHAPRLDGDWPTAWKHGWVYDLETIRMTIRPPVGIYRHHWDGMQIHSPRAVLGEAALDALCLSYADMALAKEVMVGVFADAPMDNVPCSREDGSMNMISENGSECGTGPNWGFPFLVIQSMFLRAPDLHWLGRLYPYLERYLEWWKRNRSDADGWFHADCSWESGQDGSQRFRVSGDTPGASTLDVRTVDIEASVAHAMQTMAAYARLLGDAEREGYWQEQAEDRLERVRSMYVDGWFRDFDANTGDPIIIDDYYDIMMLCPVSLGLATEQQIAGVKDKFQHFRDNPRHWLEWPSFMFPYTEAAWRSDLRLLSAEVLAQTADRIYARTDAAELNHGTGVASPGLPARYNYRIPGVANEFWPLSIEGVANPGGCEHYGWGATMPTLIMRNLIGFREDARLDGDRFLLAPALPAALLVPDRHYQCGPLHFHGHTFGVAYTVEGENRLRASLHFRGELPHAVHIQDEAGQPVAVQDVDGAVTFAAVNGHIYTVSLESR